MRRPMRPATDERGIALISVIIVATLMMAILVSAMTFALNSQDVSRHDQDWNASLSSAEGAIDDYLYRLNRDGQYWQYNAGNPPPDANDAYQEWVGVPGATNEGQFRYDIDASTIAGDGTVKITATGRVNNVTRSVYATLRRRNFLDYLYYTEYETKDPALYNTAAGDPFNATTAQNLCARHYYDSPPRDPACTNIFFFTRDVIKGPLHSNDAIRISGNPTFQGETSTSWNAPDPTKRWLGTGAPIFSRPGDPAYAAPLTMPPSNSAIKNEADAAVGGTGCLYTGPTVITLTATGKMNVTSPFTMSSNCAVGNNVALPQNGVVFVQGVPATVGDPNYWTPAQITAKCPGGKNPVGFPINNDITTGYGCTDGDAFVSGTLKGQLTIATSDSIIVTNNILYSTGFAGTDLLGLVADNYVEVYHPVRTSSPQDLVNLSNLKIQAAILSVKHSFRVQNYQYGSSRQKLSVTGVIAQRYRGIVGTFSGNSIVSGYEKDYVYDQRLKYLAPPHFIDPVKSAWRIVTWAEIEPVYLPGS